MTKRVRWALFLSGLLLASQTFSVPSPVRDVFTGEYATSYHFIYPHLYILFAPFCVLADALTLLGAHGTYVFLAYAVVGCLLLGRLRKGLIALSFFLIFVAWGAIGPRPMARLVAENPDTLLIDFHSHTNVSHDGRPSFTYEANRQWHLKQGYGAAFITDHNKIDASKMAKDASLVDWYEKGYSSLEGEEISLQKTHLVVLGVHERINNTPYDSDPAKVPLFIKAMHQKGLLVIASLPEYWLYHWGKGIDDFVSWGIDGFEVINSAPKALDFPYSKRLNILDVASHYNLLITGISDSHGYGFATACWNAITVPGWKTMDPNQLEKVILKKLQTDRFTAVQVLERLRYAPKQPWELLLLPFASLWIMWRMLTPVLALTSVLWIWILTLLYSGYAKAKRRD